MLAGDASYLVNPENGGREAPFLLLVGPEGDFTREELDRLQEAGARMVGLGPNRLRVETAAMALLNGCTLAWDSLRPATLEHIDNDDAPARDERLVHAA